MPPSPAPAGSLKQSLSPIIWGTAIFLLFLSCVAAPISYHYQDVFFFFLPWAKTSGGVAPWRIYIARSDCNYPPLWLYILTFIERLRLILGAGETSKIAIFLLKLPSILALSGGVLWTERYLRKPFGPNAAREGAIAFALCLGLWVDATLWGQADVPLCLFLLASAWALVQDKPLLGGLFAGLALALKLQAVFALPFLIIFAWKRFGWQKSVGALMVGILTVVLLSIPFFLYSRTSGNSLILSYTGAVGLYTTRSTEAYNIWHLTIGFDKFVRHYSSEMANSDTIPLIGPLTARHFGLTFLAIAYLPIVWRMVRNPSDKTLFWSIALAYIALFMLCTEMHERYILPGVAFLAMLYGVSPGARRFYPFWAITSLANTYMAYTFGNHQATNTVDELKTGIAYIFFRGGSTVIAITQIILLVLLYRVFWSETKPTPETAPIPPENNTAL